MVNFTYKTRAIILPDNTVQNVKLLQYDKQGNH